MWGLPPARAAPENVVVSSGCGAILSNMMLALFEPGTRVVVPAPYYPAFDSDLFLVAGCVPVPATTTHATGYALTRAALDAAYGPCRTCIAERARR